jgi:hypothetical protein
MVTGLKEVMDNLNKEIKAIRGRSTKGLIRASIIVRRSTEQDKPKTPVDLGNLRASYFTVSSDPSLNISTTLGQHTAFTGPNASKLKAGHGQVKSSYEGKIVGSRDPKVTLGFTANYAEAVHENVGAKFQRPGSGAKFLESSLKLKRREILKVIAKEAEIK